MTTVPKAKIFPISTTVNDKDHLVIGGCDLAELASEFDIPLVGFLMEDVVLHAELMQPDRIHPNARGNDVMLENLWAVLIRVLL